MIMKVNLSWFRTMGEPAYSGRLKTWKLACSLFTACLFLLVLTAEPLLASEKAGNPVQENQEEELGFLERPIGDNWVISPVILPIYSPETELGLAIGGLATFSTQPQNKDLPRSTITLVAIPSSDSAFGINADLEAFWLDDQLRTGIEGDFDTGPSDYWGVGYDAGKEIEQDDDVTEFDRDVVELPIIIGWRLGQSIFGGINFHLINMQINEESATQKIDPHYQKYGDEILNVGAGLRFVYDTRDDTLNAYSGLYVSVEANLYRDWLSSDQEFETYKFDYRQYYQITRPGRTLAWQIAGRFADGDVPWISMSTVGSSSDLRGYTYGRFRDQAAAWAQVEYRHMTDYKLWGIGRQGFTIWGGLGYIGEDFGDFSGHELPNVGIGYRVEVQDGRNLRLDFGWGDDELGVYLNFAEAF